MLNDAEDKQLIENAKKDVQFFGALYSKYIDKIYQYIYYRVNNDKETALDLAAEVFTRALKNLPNFKWQGYPYSAYLYQVARSVCCEHYGEKTTINIDDIAIQDEKNVTSEQKADLHILWEEINLLKPPLPEIFEMHFVEGLTYDEIAQVINKKPGAIRTAISRAIANLKQTYAK